MRYVLTAAHFPVDLPGPRSGTARLRVQVAPLDWLVGLVDGASCGIRLRKRERTVEPRRTREPQRSRHATKDAWNRFPATHQTMRSPVHSDINITQTKSAVQAVLEALEVFPYSNHPGPPLASQ